MPDGIADDVRKIAKSQGLSLDLLATNPLLPSSANFFFSFLIFIAGPDIVDEPPNKRNILNKQLA